GRESARTLAHTVEGLRAGLERALVCVHALGLRQTDRLEQAGDAGGLLDLELRTSAAFPSQREVARGQVGLGLGHTQWLDNRKRAVQRQLAVGHFAVRAAEPEQLITWSVGAWAVIVIHGGHEAYRGAVGWILEVRFGDLEFNLIAGGGARSGREPVGRAGAERRVARFIVATGTVGGEHILTFEIDIRSADVLGVVTVEENFDTVILPRNAVFGIR